MAALRQWHMQSADAVARQLDEVDARRAAAVRPLEIRRLLPLDVPDRLDRLRRAEPQRGVAVLCVALLGLQRAALAAP